RGGSGGGGRRVRARRRGPFGRARAGRARPPRPPRRGRRGRGRGTVASGGNGGLVPRRGGDGAGGLRRSGGVPRRRCRRGAERGARADGRHGSGVGARAGERHGRRRPGVVCRLGGAPEPGEHGIGARGAGRVAVGGRAGGGRPLRCARAPAGRRPRWRVAGGRARARADDGGAPFRHLPCLHQGARCGRFVACGDAAVHRRSVTAMRDLLIVLFVLALPGGAARAQGKLTGGLLTWERVGDFPVKPTALAFDGAGALYAVHIVDVYHLDLSGGFPGVWEFRSEEADDDALLGLGPDTLIATGGHTERSTDGGWTWVEVHEDGSDSSFGLHEAAPDTPFAGNLFVGSFPPAASEDRGATWEERGQIPGFGESADVFVTLSSGRLVAGAHWGAAYSDDAGWTWQTSSLWEFG